MSANDVLESASALLGLKELRPETVSHIGRGMTDFGDKSQVISRIAEAVLTRKDLPQDALPEHDDSGAPLDFSSSLSSIIGHTPPSGDAKGQVDESPPPQRRWGQSNGPP